MVVPRTNKFNFWLSVQGFVCPYLEQGKWGQVSQLILRHENLWLFVVHGQPKFWTLFMMIEVLFFKQKKIGKLLLQATFGAKKYVANWLPNCIGNRNRSVDMTSQDSTEKNTAASLQCMSWTPGRTFFQFRYRECYWYCL